MAKLHFEKSVVNIKTIVLFDALRACVTLIRFAR